MSLPYAFLAPAMLSGDLIATVPRRLAEQGASAAGASSRRRANWAASPVAPCGASAAGDAALSWLIDLLADACAQTPAPAEHRVPAMA
jgi:hypothetical protein